MRHKVKRKVLLLGMAVAASFPASAFAVGSGKVERQGHHHSGSGSGASASYPADVIQESPEMRIGDEGEGTASMLLGKLKDVATNLGSRVEAVATVEQSWSLELSRSEYFRLGSTDNPKVSAGKPVGVALRLKF